MNTSNAIKVTSLIASACFILFVLGWIISVDILVYCAFFVLGICFLFFNKDLALDQEKRFKANFLMARTLIIFVGLVFAIGGLIQLIK